MRYLTLLFIFAVTVFAEAREPMVKTVTVEDVYPLNPRETQEEGKLRAIERAKLKAIADEFGTAMAETSHLSMSNTNGKSDSQFNSYSISDVNGEWIETISEDVNLISDKNMLAYKVKIKGKIRELLNNKIDLDITLMANGTDPQLNRLKSDTYVSGEYMYIYFMSPVDGFLAVYLTDCDEEQTTQCLVPYRGTNEGAMKIDANKPYILFSREDADESVRQKVSRIKFNTHNPVDFNQLYIVFSPKEFVKVVDKDSTAPESIIYDSQGNSINLMPRQTDFKSFQKWLGKARQKDADMQLIHHIIKIEK